MIKVTTLKGVPFYLNSDLIYRIEQAPDTKLVMADGKSVWVQEPPELVVRRIKDYHRDIHTERLRVIRREDPS